MRALPILIFCITALAQWAVPLFGIRQHEEVLKHGVLVKFKCRAPDPYDPLRGRYLAVRPEAERLPVPAGLKIASGMEIYISLSMEDDGFGKLGCITFKPPATGFYIRAKSGHSYGDTTAIKWPFERYYLNENLAPDADKWLAENTRGEKRVVAEIRILDGRSVLADLSFDGKPLRETLRDKAR